MKQFFSGMLITLALVLAIVVGVVAIAESAETEAPQLPATEQAPAEAAPEAEAPATESTDSTALKEALDAYNAARQSSKVEGLEAELKGYVESGKLTQEQADLILNSSAVGFAGLNITEGGWLRAMAIPTTVYCLLVFGLFCVLFGKKLFGVRLRATESNEAQLGNSALAPADKRMLAVMLGTVLLWATESLHGLNASLVTLAAILLMFLNGNLRLQDLRSIDVTTLIFLTAAFSIGGSMKASGIAEHVFGTLAAIFPKSYSVLYILTIVGVSMVMHLILGSNTTSLSIVLPGLIAICSSVVPAQEVFFLVFFTVAAQYILPFHSVAMMIGVSNGDFPAPYVTRFGVPLSILLLASVFCIYIPWWHLIGMI